MTDDIESLKEIKRFFVKTKGGAMTEIYLDSIEKQYGIKIKDCTSHLNSRCKAYAKALLVLSHPKLPISASLLLIEDLTEKFFKEGETIPFRLLVAKLLARLPVQ